MKHAKFVWFCLAFCIFGMPSSVKAQDGYSNYVVYYICSETPDIGEYCYTEASGYSFNTALSILGECESEYYPATGTGVRFQNCGNMWVAQVVGYTDYYTEPDPCGFEYDIGYVEADMQATIQGYNEPLVYQYNWQDCFGNSGSESSPLLGPC